MGQGLPKAVESVIIERVAGTAFRVGMAEVNGWRVNMEDAHTVILRDNWGFFGVFDGHGGDQCSKFVAKRLTEELQGGPPPDNAAITDLILRIDQEFLDSCTPSGSTATFCFVDVPPAPGGKYKLRVGNAGDSRVLLGRIDGAIVDGNGTDQGLTIDHKPDNPDERARIERCGGHVESVMGVARVNGDLAVSRGFGDADHKKTGGPGPEDHPISAAPDIGHFEASTSDFLMLVCDGVSEGDFPNPAVVELAAQHLRESGDPGAAAAAICRRAIQQGSKDNISCMIVLFGGVPGATGEVQREFIPGPYTNQGAFRDAYRCMAERAGLTLAEAVGMRYEACVREFSALQQRVGAAAGSPQEAAPEGPQSSPQAADAEGRLQQLQEELQLYGEPRGAEGSPERAQYWAEWAETQCAPPAEGQGDGPPGQQGQTTVTMAQLRMLADQNPQLRGLLMQQGIQVDGGEQAPGAGRRVKATTLNELKEAVSNHQALRWEDGMTQLAEAEGTVIVDDSSDGTTQVRFPAPLGVIAWLPTDTLTDLGDQEEEAAANDGQA
eukprot:TRINITY_DN34_c3_g1_i1.p1 TRINITY_DN34_c3_g1~~TRINITY_DN34_c3_g1_i1.p1  ORF type:complete len:551 (+),score=151.15 TRINITY_DN34_c3_g1_i1:110-1762(+)